jgi:hypothetical protein
MVAQRYYLRFGSKLQKEWLEGVAVKYDDLAKIFDLAEKEQSVWEAHHPDEEIVMLAAYLLARGSLGDAWTVLRIREEDLSAVGVELSNQALGTTGVPWADYRHRDLIGSRDNFVALTQHICEVPIRRYGQDRLRRIGSIQLKCITGCIPAHRPKDCAWPSYAILKKGYRHPGIETVREVIHKLAFPDEVVRPKAYAKSTGDQLKDWHEAENTLRHDYCEAFVGRLAQVQ